MQIVIAADGSARCVYGEEFDLHALGRLAIRRGSHVEPTEDGGWTWRPAGARASVTG